ncbi:MAG: DNA translocase FtsK 4TM domain-containing protein [Phycisphaerae bacterium]
MAKSRKQSSSSGKKAASQSKQPASDAGGGLRFLKYLFILTLACVTVLAWMSMLTYDATDWPAASYYPARSVSNLAGRAGSLMAYSLRRYVGLGVYAVLIFATALATLMIIGRKIRDVWWRLVGVGLLVVSISTWLYLKDPQPLAIPHQHPAGVLGMTVGEFLLAKFAAVGSGVIVLAVFLVGLLLTADRLVLAALRGVRRLFSNSQKTFPDVLAAVRTNGSTPDSKMAQNSARTTLKGKSAGKSGTDTPKAEPSTKPAAAEADQQPDQPKDKESGPARSLVGLFSRSDGKDSKQDKPTPQKTPVPKAKPAAKSARAPKRRKQSAEEFQMPSLDLLMDPEGGFDETVEAAAAEKAQVLQRTLTDFNVEAQVVGHMTGPVITMYELALAPGVKVSAISNLSTDISRAMAVPGVRVVSPLPGKSTIGVEVPNDDKEIVRIKELMGLAPEAEHKYNLPVYLGKDASGDPIVSDLSRMPHCLIAGTTGSGKSVCINAIIMSLMLTRTPDEIRFIMVDPKMVEMAAYEETPHLLCPIVNDMRKAEEILEWAATKMDERYELFKEAGVRNIAGYNKLSEKALYERFGVESDEEKARIPKKIPYYVIIVDELADMMMTSGKDVEGHIIRIAQKARAVGIHLVLATQRPSVNVVTGLIKSNMPCRISFRVASRQESRIVLDQNGADVLLGQGDMLFLKPGTSTLVRAQGTYVDDDEIHAVTGELKKVGDPEYNSELIRLQSRPAGEISGERDELFDKAVEVIIKAGRGSVSLLQRRLQIGYGRSSRIIEEMAEAGILGEHKGSQAREVLYTMEDWEQFKNAIDNDLSGESSMNGEPTSV